MWFSKSIKQSLKELNSNAIDGLTDEEAEARLMANENLSYLYLMSSALIDTIDDFPAASVSRS
jgi:hypothetical protein